MRFKDRSLGSGKRKKINGFQEDGMRSRQRCDLTVERKDASWRGSESHGEAMEGGVLAWTPGSRELSVNGSCYSVRTGRQHIHPVRLFFFFFPQ